MLCFFHIFIILCGFILISLEAAVNLTELSTAISLTHKNSGEYDQRLFETLKNESAIGALLRSEVNHKEKLLQDLKKVFSDNSKLFLDRSEDKSLENSVKKMRGHLDRVESLPEFVNELAQYYTLIKNPPSNQEIIKNAKELSSELVGVLKEYTNERNNWKPEDHDMIVEINDLCKISPVIVIVIAASILIILILGCVGFYFLLRSVKAAKTKQEDLENNTNI